MKITAVLKGHKDVQGRQAVFIRRSDRQKRTHKQTQIKVKPEQFKNGKVINHELARDYNERIRKYIAEAELGSLDAPKPVLFNTFATQCLNEWDGVKKWSTLKQIKGEITKLRKFADPYLHQVNLTFLNKYKAYCVSLGNTNNSLWKSFKTLRLIIRKAHREKLITDNPFEIFEFPKYKDPPRHYLTKAQVDKIDQYEGPHSFFTTWFVIACYTGLRYSDQASFDKSKIKNGRLVIYTSKTGQVVSIKMNDKLKALFERVGYKPMSYSGVHYNRVLKAVGAELKIREELTSHIARHTFGTLCASAGISQEVTAKLMGHSSIRTTAIYYQISGTRLDDELLRIF